MHYKDGLWVIGALAMENDWAYENERTMWKGVVHGSAQAEAAHENFHPIVWEAEIFRNDRDTLILLPTYAIRGSKAKKKRRTRKECEIAAHRNSRQDTKTPRKLVVAAHAEGLSQKHPGVEIILSGVVARKTHPGLQKQLFTHDTQPYLTTKNHTCVQAAFGNATFAVAALEAAGRVQQPVEE